MENSPHNNSDISLIPFNVKKIFLELKKQVKSDTSKTNEQISNENNS